MVLLMDAPMSTPSLLHYLSIIPDFRQFWKLQHQPSDILLVLINADQLQIAFAEWMKTRCDVTDT